MTRKITALDKEPQIKINTGQEYQQLLSILNNLEDVIYVSDPKSYEILYVNHAVEKDFGNVIGKKCHEIFQGLKEPCPFCTNDIILGEQPGKAYIWEHQNRRTKRWYRCIDKAIVWPNDRIVRFEIAVDITEQKAVSEKSQVYDADLSYLWKTCRDYTCLDGNHDLFQVLAAQLKSISSSPLILTGPYEPKQNRIYFRCLQTADQNIEQTIRDLNIDPAALFSSVTSRLRPILMSGSLLPYPGNFTDFLRGSVATEICRKTEKLLCLGDIYIMGLSHLESLLGAVVIIPYRATELRHRYLLETIINQAVLCLQRQRFTELYRQHSLINQQSIKNTINALFLALEKRDPYTANHEHRVAQLSQAIGKIMGLSHDQREGLRITSDLHDIGKIVVPSEILNKPAKLNDNEYAIIKTHSQVGYEILKELTFPWPVAQTVLQHHERLDGSGYPWGLTGNEIGLEARIVAVADVVEAMSSHRPYRPALSINEALMEITRFSGVRYDPNVVQACVQVFIEDKFKFD